MGGGDRQGWVGCWAVGVRVCVKAASHVGMEWMLGVGFCEEAVRGVAAAAGHI